MASAPSMTSMKKGGPAPSHAQMKKFLESGLVMMKSDATRELLKDPSILKPGKHLVEMQRSGWDPEGIDRDIGCKTLDIIPNSDTELCTLQEEFVHTSARVYLQALEDRKPRQLERVKMIPRETIVEFFDSCNTKMQLPEVQKMLFQVCQSIKKPPVDAIMNLQREQLEVLGIEADHGFKKLSEIGEAYPKDKDQELHQRKQNWEQVSTNIGKQIMQMVAVQEARMEVMNDPEKLKMMKKVQEDLAKMTPTERGDLVMEMQKKVQTIQNLPQADQEAYVNKQGPEFKMKFMKAQVLMQHVRMQQMQQMQNERQAEDGKSASGAGTTASDPLLMTGSAKAPSQQQMM